MVFYFKSLFYLDNNQLKKIKTLLNNYNNASTTYFLIHLLLFLFIIIQFVFNGISLLTINPF